MRIVPEGECEHGEHTARVPVLPRVHPGERAEAEGGDQATHGAARGAAGQTKDGRGAQATGARAAED